VRFFVKRRVAGDMERSKHFAAGSSRVPSEANGASDDRGDRTVAIGAEELYMAHADFVAAFLGRLGASGAEVEDMQQEVFLIAHRNGGYRPGPARPTTWLAEIGARVYANARRAKARAEARRSECEPDATAAPHDDPERHAERRAGAERMAKALATLDDRQRALLLLFELEGVPCAELAEVFGVPRGTIHSRLHAARQRLREAWERLESETARSPRRRP
jgi:RNA polymerase sigma-70 factor (ECF subfamily)